MILIQDQDIQSRSEYRCCHHVGLACQHVLLSGDLDKADWVKNLLRNPQVSVKIRDSVFTGQGRLVKDAGEDALARQLIAGKYPSTDEEDLTEWYRDALPVAVDLII